MSPLEDASLCVALDIRNPFSYLALQPTIDLVEETGVQIEWLPIRAHSLVAPSSPTSDDDRGTRHRRARAQMIAREIAIYSEAQAIEIEAPYRDGSADALHTAWLWVRHARPTHVRQFLSAAFADYWANGLDPASSDNVAQLLEREGFDLDPFQRWGDREGATALQSLASRLVDAGVFQAPAYLLDGEVFYGRQHLPMIRWILEGRIEKGPI